MNTPLYWLLLLLIKLTSLLTAATDQPNIIFILADDLGWNDVGFNGETQIPTPNIDAMACSGVILNRYYVTPICTPSRSALMTGKYPIHTGMQHTVLFGAEPRGLPLTEKLLPQYLKDLGYTTRHVGKWHLGNWKKEYTPLYRGFDSHIGYWTGHHDYNDHTAMETQFWGLDMRRGMDVAYDLHGQYSTDVFTREAVNVIKTHNGSKPLFLYLAHAAVHSGNPYNPLPAPDETVAKFDYIPNYQRRKFAAMLSKLDDSVGQVVTALKETGLLENSIVIFSTDNGGPADGFNLNAASNWPLRGVKNTLWEGGVRGAGLIWSPLITNQQRVGNQVMHISDWLPTLYSAAGGDESDLGEIDGINVWTALSEDEPSNRTQILHNIDDIYGNSALTLGNYKIVKGSSYNGEWDSWYGPAGRTGWYSVNAVLKSPAGRALTAIGHGLLPSTIQMLRQKAEVVCNVTPEIIREASNCKPMVAPCLFNIMEDPCELVNLAEKLPHVLKHLEKTLSEVNATAIPPGNLPVDPRGDPRYWDYTWTNFGDYNSKMNVVPV